MDRLLEQKARQASESKQCVDKGGVHILNYADKLVEGKCPGRAE